MACNQGLSGQEGQPVFGHEVTHELLLRAKDSSIATGNANCAGGACPGLTQACGYVVDHWDGTTIKIVTGGYLVQTTSSGHCECQEQAPGT